MANSVDTGKNGDFAKDHSTTDLLRRLNSQFDADKVAAERRRADSLAKSDTDTEEKSDDYIFDGTSMTDEEKAESDEFKSLYEKYLGRSEQNATADEPVKEEENASDSADGETAPRGEEPNAISGATSGESSQKRTLFDMLASLIPDSDKEGKKSKQAADSTDEKPADEQKPLLTEVENDLDLSVFSSRSDGEIWKAPVKDSEPAEEPETAEESEKSADNTPVGDIIKLKLDDDASEPEGAHDDADETEAGEKSEEKPEEKPEEESEEAAPEAEETPKADDDYSTDDENAYTEEIIERYNNTEMLEHYQPNTEVKEEPDDDEKEADDPDRDTEIMMAFGLDPRRADKNETPKKIFDDYPFSATVQTTATDIPSVDGNTEDDGNVAETDESTEKKPSVSYEYKSFDQTKEVFDRYKQKYSMAKVRIGIAAFFAAVLFIIECIPAIGEALGMTGFILLDFALTFLCAFFALGKLVGGVRSLVVKKPDGNAFIPAMFLISFVTTLSALFAGDDTVLRFYNFTFAFCVLFSAIASYIGIRKEIYTFNIISSKKRKLVLARAAREDSVEERAGFARHIEDDAEIYKTREAKFIDDFFARKKEYPKEKKIIGILLAASAAVSLIVFVLSLTVGKASFFESMTNMYFTMLMCAPASVLVSYTYAAYLASIRAYSYGAAIVGDTTPEEYEKAGVISFGDNVAFPADKLRIRSVKIFENNSIEDVIYLASSVYSKLGGPLATVFRKAALDGITADNVEILSLAENGAEAAVDGHSVVIGQPAYMDNQCYSTTYEAGDELYEGDTNKRILYLAKDNSVIAKFYLQYNASSDFIYIVRHLSEQGICTAVTTADPGLDSALLNKNKLSPDAYPIKIIKPMMPQEEMERVSAHDAGIVSNHDAKGLIKTLIACEKTRNIGKTNLAIKFISMLVATALTVLLTVTGNYDKMLPFYPALYQLFWMIPMYLVSKIYI